MELTLREIASKEPLYFKSGNSEVLKELLFKNDNELYPFAGKDQYLSRIRAVLPDIDADLLLIDYNTSRRLLWTSKIYTRNVYTNGTDPSKLQIRFDYDELCEDYAVASKNELFKSFDKVIRPLSDPIWIKYLPPNFVGDRSNFSIIIFEESTDIPRNLPSVDRDFMIDRWRLYLDGYILKSKIKSRSPENWKITIDIGDNHSIDVMKPILDSMNKKKTD